MRADLILREARLRAGLSQRELSARADVAQPSIARIESGAVVPRVDTLAHLLAACGLQLVATPAPGAGIDRGSIRAMLALTPTERLRLAAVEGRHLEHLVASARRR